MEAQDQDPHDIAAGDQGEHNNHEHGEKKSVLKKVKDKAKKIKDTIKKQGYSSHEHQYRHDQISEEEEEEDDDGDEDMMNAPPQVHGAPMYESPVIAGTNLPIQTDVPNVRNEVYPNIVGDGGVISPPGPGKMRTELERSSVEAGRPEFEQTVQISPLIGLEEDPHSNPPSNYQCKVTDPTGEVAKEAEVGSLLRRLDKFHIHGQSESNTAPEQRSLTGGHDQFTPDHSTSTVDQFIPESNLGDLSKNPESPKSLDGGVEPHQSTPRDSTIARKISSATSAIADKAASAKDLVASKLGYGKKPVTELATECEHKAAPEKQTPVSDQVGGDTVAEGTDRGVSVMKEYLAEKLRPGEEDKALSKAIMERFYKKKDMGMHGKEEEVQPVAACFGGVTGSDESSGSGSGVVGRLKGTVGSWLGKSDGHSLGQSHGSVPGVGVEQSKEEIGLQ